VRIRARLFLTFLVLVGLGFLLLTRSITLGFGPRYLAAVEESMVDMATVLSAFLETRTAEKPLGTNDLRAVLEDAKRKEFSAKIYEMTKKRLGIRVYVTDRRGIVVFDSDNGRNEGKNYSRWNDVMRTLRGAANPLCSVWAERNRM
jgi:two-component system, OmpR family, sensor histidine kinase CreC